MLLVDRIDVCETDIAEHIDLACFFEDVQMGNEVCLRMLLAPRRIDMFAIKQRNLLAYIAYPVLIFQFFQRQDRKELHELQMHVHF